MTTRMDVQERVRRFACLRPLVEDRETETGDAAIRKVLVGGAAKLKGVQAPTAVEFLVTGSRRGREYTVHMGAGGPLIKEGRAKGAALTIAVSEEDLLAMARGKVSPAEVFLRGRIRIEGSCVLARQIYRDLAGRGDLLFD